MTIEPCLLLLCVAMFFIHNQALVVTLQCFIESICSVLSKVR